ncbi:uncharacterized protein LOC127261248 [Andrographis paniculata]|uniref:uncharacterized protein LOC127261248 n=1 Tax=Andrographis paniculata TaxID=175694 RepID=UPI0021E994C3|nr:uncharacterized protein LOC127261248 [Andrographis paniculata]
MGKSECTIVSGVAGPSISERPSEVMADGESPRSSSADANTCPICLTQITEDSYLDQCFHKFCYNCIIRWTNVVASKQSCVPSSVKCPLCKRDNWSIIYGYDGQAFQRHYVGQSLGNSEFFSEAHRYRLKCYYTDIGDFADKLNVSRFWKFHKYKQQNRFLPDWLRREIQAVLQEEDVDIIMHHILGVIDSLRRKWLKDSKTSIEMAQEEFKASVSEAIRPFLTGRTERFVSELELFLSSGLNIDAYDKVYTKHLGWKIPQISEDEYDETLEHMPSSIPYLHIFEGDSDEN